MKNNKLITLTREILEKLINSVLDNEGYPPNMTKRVRIQNIKHAIALYHVFNNNPSHLKNGGGTTSESQVLFFNQMVLWAALTGKNINEMIGAYNYMRYFMMPNDGLETEQLPDSELRPQDPATKRNMHWLIQIADNKNKSLAGDCVFEKGNILYRIYDGDIEGGFTPCIALKNDCTLDLNKTLKDNNTFKFGAALDADQWIIRGYFFATLFGIYDFTHDLRETKETLLSCLIQRGRYKNIMNFARYWGGNIIENSIYMFHSIQLYTGYQTPGCYYILNEKEIAREILLFLKDTQNLYSDLYNETGPFIPLYDVRKNKFTWNGIDSNTHWMGFQFRTFTGIAMYYFLSQDPDAKKILDKFIHWIDNNSVKKDSEILLPSSLNSGLKDGAGIEHSNGPIGTVENCIFSPDSYGLYIQGLSLIYAVTCNTFYIERIHELLKKIRNHQEDNGLFALIENNQTVTKEIYGFHQAEMAIGLSLYLLIPRLKDSLGKWKINFLD